MSDARAGGDELESMDRDTARSSEIAVMTSFDCGALRTKLTFDVAGRSPAAGKTTTCPAPVALTTVTLRTAALAGPGTKSARLTLTSPLRSFCDVDRLSNAR